MEVKPARVLDVKCFVGLRLSQYDRCPGFVLYVLF